MIVAVQLLDGVSAAVVGVLDLSCSPMLCAALGHYDLAQGALGAAVGIGVSLSTALAGYITDHAGSSGSFLFMAGVAGLGLLLIVTLMPETRDVERRWS